MTVLKIPIHNSFIHILNLILQSEETTNRRGNGVFKFGTGFHGYSRERDAEWDQKNTTMQKNEIFKHPGPLRLAGQLAGCNIHPSSWNSMGWDRRSAIVLERQERLRQLQQTGLLRPVG